MEEMQGLLLKISRSLANITTEQQNVQVRIEEISIEHTTPLGFKLFLHIRDPNQAQSSRSPVLNLQNNHQSQEVEATRLLQPPNRGVVQPQPILLL